MTTRHLTVAAFAVVLSILSARCAIAVNGKDTGKASELPWEEFSLEGLKESTSDGKQVLVYFRGDFCPQCRQMEANVWNAKRIRKQVHESGVVLMQADLTDSETEDGRDLWKTMQSFARSRPTESMIFPSR